MAEGFSQNKPGIDRRTVLIRGAELAAGAAATVAIPFADALAQSTPTEAQTIKNEYGNYIKSTLARGKKLEAINKRFEDKEAGFTKEKYIGEFQAEISGIADELLAFSEHVFPKAFIQKYKDTYKTNAADSADSLARLSNFSKNILEMLLQERDLDARKSIFQHTFLATYKIIGESVARSVTLRQ